MFNINKNQRKNSQNIELEGPGPDSVHGYWIKMLVSMQERIALHLKLITGIVADEIYNHLEENDLLPEEQKGCHRNSGGTKDQLLTDKAVMKNCRRRKVGLSMVWIDYRNGWTQTGIKC